ncbi:MAG: hypothetical protein ACRC62_24145 [Microcoleus sp.]
MKFCHWESLSNYGGCVTANAGKSRRADVREASLKFQSLQTLPRSY